VLQSWNQGNGLRVMRVIVLEFFGLKLETILLLDSKKCKK
jgi:hypothetical protein